MNPLLKSTLIVITLFALATVACAHHSISGSYDLKSQFTLRGTVTKVILRNPHPMLFLDVVNSGRTESWVVEGANSNWLGANGSPYRQDLPELDILRKLKVGMVVTVSGFRSLDPSEHKAAFATLLDDQGKEIGSVPTPR